MSRGPESFGSLPEDRSEVMNGNLDNLQSVYQVGKVEHISVRQRIFWDQHWALLNSRYFLVCISKSRPPQQITPLIGYSVHLPCAAGSDLKTTITLGQRMASFHFL